MNRPFDLSAFSIHGDAKASLGPALSFVSPAGQWHYAVSLPCSTIETLAVVEIETEISKGAVGFGLTDRLLSSYVTGEVTAHPGAGRHVVRVLVEYPQPDLVLVARNHSATGELSEGKIYRIETHPSSKYASADIKRMRAGRHSYWHYSFDLGEGVNVEASLKGGMDYHHLNQQIMFGLLDLGFPQLAGLEVLDAACASGFHSFGLARKGMRVTAIDIDRAGIEQARFVQSCLAEQPVRSVRFEQADLLTYSREPPFDLFFCSGLFYHLRDLVGAAKKLYDLTALGGVVQSCVAEGDADVMELANPAKFICCFEGEFSFVPTASMLTKIFQYVGFQKIQSFQSVALREAKQIGTLTPGYADLFRRNTAYWVLKKS